MRSQFLAGVRAELAIAVGVIPFGLIFGVLALDAGLHPWLAQSMSSIVFAGSAQFIAAQLFGSGAPAVVIVVTTLVVNLRHALYSTSLLPHVRHLPRRWQALLAYLLTDEAYAVTILHYMKKDNREAPKAWFFLGAGVTLWVTWQLSTAAGIFLGTQVPETWALDFTLALTFIGLVVPTLRQRPVLVAAMSAGLTAVLAAGLPYRLGLLLAAGVGIAGGMLAERRPGAGEAIP
jgi:4-azaleucine resistance transporter AzlC